MKKVTEYDGHKMPIIYDGVITPEILERKKAAIENASNRLKALKKIYNERRNALMDELVLRFTDFDFGSAMRELLSWQNELGTDPDDELTYTVLEGVKDLIIDNCTFE